MKLCIKAEYVNRSLSDEEESQMTKDQIDLLNRPGSKHRVTILNEMHLTSYLRVRREVSEALGVASAFVYTCRRLIDLSLSDCR